jgi:preprotein translocase SecE subunit
MAVIRSKKGSDETGDGPAGAVEGKSAAGSTPPAPVDRTRSVVKSPAPVQRAPRAPGRAAMPGGAPVHAPDTSRNFFGDMMTELKRVVWPSREEVQSGTIVTLGLLIFFSLYIAGLDFLAERFFQSLGFYN